MPPMLDTEVKYKKCIEGMKDIQKFTQFMEEELLLNSINLSDSELWEAIQQIATDVLANHPATIKPLEVQKWIVCLDQALNDSPPIYKKAKTMPQKMATDSDSSSSSSSSSSSDSVPSSYTLSSTTSHSYSSSSASSFSYSSFTDQEDMDIDDSDELMD